MAEMAFIRIVFFETIFITSHIIITLLKPNLFLKLGRGRLWVYYYTAELQFFMPSDTKATHHIYLWFQIIPQIIYIWPSFGIMRFKYVFYYFSFKFNARWLNLLWSDVILSLLIYKLAGWAIFSITIHYERGQCIPWCQYHPNSVSIEWQWFVG